MYEIGEKIWGAVLSSSTFVFLVKIREGQAVTIKNPDNAYKTWDCFLGFTVYTLQLSFYSQLLTTETYIFTLCFHWLVDETFLFAVLKTNCSSLFFYSH